MPAHAASDCTVHGALVHRLERRRHLLVREREEPAHAAIAALGQVQPERLHEEQSRQLLSDDDAARLR